MRRGAAAAIILIVLIGAVLAIKALLNHQARAGLSNYEANVESIVSAESTSVRDSLYRTIDNSFNNSNAGNVTTALQQLVSQEQAYYQQAQGWSVPAQMVGAQRYFVEELGLRSEALAGIESEMVSALGASSAQGHAIRLIAGDMYKLGASDVLYSDRVVPLIDEALANAGVTATTPLPAQSAFLADVGWLVPQTAAERILGYVPASLGGTPPPAGANVGHALLAVDVQTAAGTLSPLSTVGINRLPYTSSGITFVLKVENSGTVEEHDVQTTLTFYKTGLDTGPLGQPTGTIHTTRPGQAYSSSILFAPASCTALHGLVNQVLLMTAGVTPLPGENDKANNYMRFLVEFLC
jgi:hypothetical protein